MDFASQFARLDTLPYAFSLHMPDGVSRIGTGDPAFEVHVRNRRGIKALMSFDELTIAEAYVRGDLEFEGDAIALMWFRHYLSDDRWWIKIWRRLQPLLVGRERLNPTWIAKHYDSNNLQLYATDREFRAYTPGLYENDDVSLEAGTRCKYDFAFEQLGLQPGGEVLDIGHGWGGFLQYCSDRGVKGQGITLSRHQLEFVQQLIADRGLQAEVRYQDFFTYEPGRRFSAISMMGVIEDLSDYPRVFAQLAKLLEPGGRVYLDFAAARHRVNTSSFITRYVWPGTFRQVFMPEFVAAANLSPLEIVGIWDDRRNYHLWALKGHQRWLENRDEIVSRSNEETWRLFRLLFAGTAGAMGDPTYRMTAHRAVLKLPADRRTLTRRTTH